MSVTWNPALIDGPIVRPLWSEPNEDGDRTVTGYRPGYRLNVTAEAFAPREAALSAFRITPDCLARVFAGDDPENPTMTVALRFSDEAEAVAVLGPDFIAGFDAEP